MTSIPPFAQGRARAAPHRRSRVQQGLRCALLTLFGASALLAGTPYAQTTAAATAPATAPAAVFSEAELDQMLAPIALYPDSLLAQILMASTYPADVADAAKWTKAHPDDKGDAAVTKVQGQPWDPSVQSLVAFPQVLTMMGEHPDQVQRMGDAFLADPARVMDRVQFLRKKAQEAGNLKTTEQQKVSTTTEASKQVIVIEPAQPSTVYVPVYQPTVVYGSWWYPSYPPYYWPPPAYYYPPGAAFVGGVLWGAAVVGIANGLWGGVNWGRGDVDINVNRYNNINVNNKLQAGNNNFKHNPERRGDVPYRDNKSREQYGQKARDGAQSRDAYRGKDDGGRDAQRAQASQTLAQRGADPAAGRDRLQGADRDAAAAAVDRSAPRAGTADRAGGAAAGNRAGSAGVSDRAGGAGASDRAGGAGFSDRSAGGGAADRSASTRSPSAGTRDNAFSGASNPSASRASASRGSSSMSQRSAPAARPSGGGARGGGGGRGR